MTVTAKAEGKATITVTTADGGKTATCTITVVNCKHEHTKAIPATDSTCTVKGHEAYTWCEDCKHALDASNNIIEIPYKDLAPHNFTGTVVDAKYLATAATCVAPASYYKSCTVCGEKDTTATFTSGNVDSTNHVGDKTYTSNNNDTHKVICASCKTVINASEACSGGKAATCIAKSVCAKCGVEYGEFAAHKYATTWSSDGTHHWHACTVEGCNDKADGAVHSSSGKNIATCQHGNICDICGYDDKTPVAHAAAANAGYASDATNHWKLCKWCGEKVGVTAHNFDNNGKCITCGAFNKDGKVMDHKHTMDRNSKMLYDANKHWYPCSDPACAGHADEAAHNFTTTTETINGKKYEIKTCACGYVTRVEVKNNTTGTTTGTNPNAKNPYEKNDTTKKDNGKTVKSGKTFDAGIALYVGLSVLSVTGGALVIGKKKEF